MALLHDDLLALALKTFELDSGPGRPKQANLRRAVSTAYYALFHLLVHDATASLTLGGADVTKHRRSGSSSAITPWRSST